MVELEGEQEIVSVAGEDGTQALRGRAIDATGCTVMPGLIDLNSHLTLVPKLDRSQVVSRAKVALRGKRYALPPGLMGVELQLRHRLGTNSLEIYAPSGVLLAQFTAEAPYASKGNYPPRAAVARRRARLARFACLASPWLLADFDFSAALPGGRHQRAPDRPPDSGAQPRSTLVTRSPSTSTSALRSPLPV